MLIDTGASATILSSGRFQPLCEAEKEKLRPTRSRLIAANGETLPVMGEIHTQIQLGGATATTWLLIAEMKLPGVLGMDVLTQIQGVLDLGKGELRIGNHTVILSESEVDLEVHLQTVEEQDVPPWTEGVLHLVAAHSTQETLPESGWCRG